MPTPGRGDCSLFHRPHPRVLTSIRADNRQGERQGPRYTDHNTCKSGDRAHAHRRLLPCRVNPPSPTVPFSFSAWHGKAAPQTPTGSSLSPPQTPSTSTRAPDEILRAWAHLKGHRPNCSNDLQVQETFSFWARRPRQFWGET